MRAEAIAAVFGPGALGHALFYRHDLSLRFELGRGGSRTERFTSAVERGTRILDAVFEGVPRLVLVLAEQSERSGFSSALVRQLHRLELEVSRPYDTWVTRDEDVLRRTLSFEIPTAHQRRVLFGIAAVEMGVSPSLSCDGYLLAPELGVLAHAYDHRGMDVIGPNKSRLRRLYDDFSPMLLEYDRPAMDRGVGSWSG